MGYYKFPGGTIKVIDSDEIFYLMGEKTFSSIEWALNVIWQIKDDFGMDVSGYAEQLEYPGFSSDFVEQWIDFQNRHLPTSTIDVLSVTDFYEWDNPVSKGFLPYVWAVTCVLEGLDDRSFDEVVADLSANVESNIDWNNPLSGADFHFVIPRINKEGAANLLRTVCDLVKSHSFSARKMSLLRR